MMGRNLIIPPLLSVSGMAMFVTATGLCRPPVFTLAERLAGVGVALLAYVAGFVLVSREEHLQRRETSRRSLPPTQRGDVASCGVSPGNSQRTVTGQLQPGMPAVPHSSAWLSAAGPRTRTSHERRRVEHHSYEPSH